MVFYYPKPINDKKGNKNVKDKQDIIEIEENKGKYDANFGYVFNEI